MVPGLLIPALAAAQDEPRQEIAVQGTGHFTKDSSGSGINQHSTDTGGFLVSYRYHFSRWLAADASYGYDRNTQENFISSGAFNIAANVHQATGALVVTAPHKIIGLKPYVLAGSGALIFEPTGNLGGFVSGASNQARAVFLYGGGVDYDLTEHFALRAEYRVRAPGLWIAKSAFRRGNAHSAALGWYRLSVLTGDTFRVRHESRTPHRDSWRR